MRPLLTSARAHLRTTLTKATATTVTTTLGLLAFATTAQAHPGHGLPSASHWHADNVLLVLALAAAGAAGLWFTRRK